MKSKIQVLYKGSEVVREFKTGMFLSVDSAKKRAIEFISHKLDKENYSIKESN